MANNKTVNPAALKAADAVAFQLVGRASPVRFGRAQSQDQIEAIYRLRCRIVIERGWARLEDLPDGMERDADDANAVHIAAWEGDALAGTARLVLPSPGRLLPTEKAFGLDPNLAGHVADVGRICVSQEWTSPQHLVWLGLVGQIWIEMRSFGFLAASTILTPAVARVYRRWGLEVISLGASRPFWNEERFPGLIQPADSVGRGLRTIQAASGSVIENIAPRPGSLRAVMCPR